MNYHYQSRIGFCFGLGFFGHFCLFVWVLSVVVLISFGFTRRLLAVEVLKMFSGSSHQRMLPRCRSLNKGSRILILKSKLPKTKLVPRFPNIFECSDKHASKKGTKKYAVTGFFYCVVFHIEELEGNSIKIVTSVSKSTISRIFFNPWYS